MTDFVEPTGLLRALPAEAEGPVGRGRYGFIVDPPSSHIEQSAASFRALAKVLSSRRLPDTAWKQVWLGHVLNNGFLSISLYSFPFNEFNSGGELIDIGDPDVPLRLAVVANLPVALQLQVVLSTLGDYVARQEYVASIMHPHEGPGKAIDDIDVRVEQLDQLVQESVIDDLRLGWETSARHIAQRAADIGLTFDVRYKAPLASDAEVLQRCNIARRTYNELELVRMAVDRTVSLIAGHELELRGGNVPESLRTLIQQSTAAAEMSRYLAHLLRDSLVCGNGYLRIPEFEPFGFYCLPPDLTIPLGAERYQVSGSEVIKGDRVIHLQGLRQLDSQLGLSVLEPALIEYAKRRVFESIEAAIAPRVNRLRDTERQWFEARRKQHERVVKDGDERLRRLFVAPLGGSSVEARREIYLPSFERYESSS